MSVAPMVVVLLPAVLLVCGCCNPQTRHDVEVPPPSGGWHAHVTSTDWLTAARPPVVPAS